MPVRGALKPRFGRSVRRIAAALCLCVGEGLGLLDGEAVHQTSPPARADSVLDKTLFD